MAKQKINYRNLIISLISCGIFGIIISITINNILIYLTDLQIILSILLSSALACIGIITLFPVFEKEEKKSKKKKDTFKKAIMSKRK